MSSPQATTVDPRKPGQYTLKIGEGFKAGSTSSSPFSSIRFNHKPNLSGGSRTTKLSQDTDQDASLSITDQEDGKRSKYLYKGKRSQAKQSYVLVFDPDQQTCTLEPVRASYNFNLSSTPWETSEERLHQQYPQLSSDHSSSAGGQDLDPNGEPDPDNPYDYRHYLHAPPPRTSPSPSPAHKSTSTFNTPTLSSTRIGAPALSKSQNKSSSKTDPLRQAPRKQKASATPAKANQKSMPSVRLERRASTRPNDASEKKVSKPAKVTVKSDYYVHSSDDEEDAPEPSKSVIDESGGLEIDWGNQPPRGARSRVLDLPETSSKGPISLHSAANSPAGRMAPASRQQQKKKQDYQQDIIDFGDSEVQDDDEEAEEPQSHKLTDDVQMQDAADDGSDGDSDVEPMELGSPAHQNTGKDADATGGAEDDADFDDDFEAQMMEAMADEDDQPVLEEESEESEAE